MLKELIFFSDLRIDGRRKDEIRDMEITMDVVKDSNGSAMVSMGQTKAVAWINGPKEGRSKNFENKGILKCIFSLAPFSTLVRKKDYKRDLKMREFSKTLKDVFEQVISLENYRKSEIIINVLILQHDGSYKSAAINAITLALINAGILMKDTVIGISLGLHIDKTSSDTDYSILYDLKLNEEKDNIPLLNVAYLPHKRKFAFLELLNAKTPYDHCDVLMKHSEKAAEKLFDVIEKFLKYELK